MEAMLDVSSGIVVGTHGTVNFRDADSRSSTGAAHFFILSGVMWGSERRTNEIGAVTANIN